MKPSALVLYSSLSSLCILR